VRDGAVHRGRSGLWASPRVISGSPERERPRPGPSPLAAPSRTRHGRPSGRTAPALALGVRRHNARAGWPRAAAPAHPATSPTAIARRHAGRPPRSSTPSLSVGGPHRWGVGSAAGHRSASRGIAAQRRRSAEPPAAVSIPWISVRVVPRPPVPSRLVVCCGFLATSCDADGRRRRSGPRWRQPGSALRGRSLTRRSRPVAWGERGRNARESRPRSQAASGVHSGQCTVHSPVCSAGNPLILHARSGQSAAYR
jgi:hypothetical protein